MMEKIWDKNFLTFFKSSKFNLQKYRFIANYNISQFSFKFCFLVITWFEFEVLCLCGFSKKIQWSSVVQYTRLQPSLTASLKDVVIIKKLCKNWPQIVKINAAARIRVAMMLILLWIRIRRTYQDRKQCSLKASARLFFFFWNRLTKVKTLISLLYALNILAKGLTYPPCNSYFKPD